MSLAHLRFLFQMLSFHMKAFDVIFWLLHEKEMWSLTENSCLPVAVLWSVCPCLSSFHTLRHREVIQSFFHQYVLNPLLLKWNLYVWGKNNLNFLLFLLFDILFIGAWIILCKYSNPSSTASQRSAKDRYRRRN